MAPSVADNVANFYTKTSFGGDESSYKIGDDVKLDGSLNDKFHSVNIGSAAKVVAWQHIDSTGNYREWHAANPDISDIGGLSRFIVVNEDTRAIAFLFKDATGGKDRQYSLKVDAADVGTVTMYSNDGEDYRLVGIIPAGGPPVTTAIYVRDEHSGVYIAIGSVFFQWNSKIGGKFVYVPSPKSVSFSACTRLTFPSSEVDIVENENWPKQLKVERSDASRFIVTLVDNKPSE